MPPWTEIGLAIGLGPPLWLSGAIFFDFVHCVLHAMLRSRWRLVRTLARPHAIHHEWIDTDLEIRWENQRRNVWCHIVPEYATQLAFTAAVALVLPWTCVAVLAALQTAVFLSILHYRGLDLNHRPVTRLDAYRPGCLTPPAYHALHHVYPDAYFSAYTKLIDVLVGGGAQLRGRRFTLLGATGPFGSALCDALERSGAQAIRVDAPGALDLASLDVLVLCDSGIDEVPLVEAFVDATRERRLPPEVWAVHARPDDATARHYVGDVRVSYRTLVVPRPAELDSAHADAAARIALARIRRGLHFVSTEPLLRALRGLRRFRATRPARPPGSVDVRHRIELATPA